MRLVYKLRVRTGPDKGLVLALEKKETLIGRGEDCELPISDPESSRHHCKVVVKGRKVEVVDLGSTNGTRVNGRPIDKAALATGGVIVIGGTEILLFSEERREDGDEPRASRATAKLGLAGKIGGLGLATKIFILMIMIALLSQALVAWPLISRQRTILGEESLKQAAVLVMALAAANREGLLAGDEMRIETRQLEGMPGVVAAMVYDRKGRTLAPVSRLHQVPEDAASQRALAAGGLLVQSAGEDIFDLAQPVKVLNPKTGQFDKVGTARIVFSQSELEKVQGGSWRAALISLVLLLAVAAGASLVIMRIASAPVNRLREEVEAVLKGDADQAAVPSGFPPLGGLTETLNRALAKLKTLQTADPAQATAPAAPLGRPALASLASVVHDALLVVDADNQVFFANQAFCTGLGVEAEAITGRHLLEAVSSQELLAASLDLIKQSTASGGALAEKSFTLADGRQVEAAASLVLASGGDPGFIALAYRGFERAGSGEES